MKNNKSKRTICLTAAALLLVAGLAVGSANAYFTTYAVAQGGYPIRLGFTETRIQETVTDKKVIEIENTGKYDCYVRIKALVGDAYVNELKYSEEEKWSKGDDDYYYYEDFLKPGEKTESITVTFPIPENTEYLDEFNVIIIQECAKVLYKEDGTPYGDWDNVADISQSTYKTEVGEQ